ncbi:MAG TPA: transporter associated domain-containing protein [Azonexus sp.]|nr:transporter associated domain-containing protein [Azonexus sp.]
MDNDSKPGLIERLAALLLGMPGDRGQLAEILRGAYERNLMDADALAIIEGALAAAETRVSDVMVPRALMEVVDINAPMARIIPFVIETAHSRFPVIDGDRDNVLGVMLAKDLLRIHVEADFDLRAWLRPVVYIPEAKRLNVLLHEFRVSRNHMAIVVNEYGSVAGLVTIEDVLEQIVGDIEDEYDFDEAYENIRLDSPGCWRVKTRTEIADFNQAFGTSFPDAEFDTVGGLILRNLGRVPKRNEVIDVDGIRFQVLRADSRRLYTLLVTPPPEPRPGVDDKTA